MSNYRLYYLTMPMPMPNILTAIRYATVVVEITEQPPSLTWFHYAKHRLVTNPVFHVFNTDLTDALRKIALPHPTNPNKSRAYFLEVRVP